MKTKILIFVCLSLFVQPIFSQKRPPKPPRAITVVRAAPIETGKPGAWRETVSETGGFRVEFPGVPGEPARFADVSLVPSPVNSGSYSIQTAGVYYHLFFTEKNAETQDSEKLKSFYDRRRDAYLEGTSLKIIRESDVFLDRHLGRERIVSDAAGTSITTTRLFLINKMFYELSATVTKSALPKEQASVERFLSSFRLTDAPPKRNALPDLEPAWREFTASKDEFKAFFPGKPIEREMPAAKDAKIKSAYYWAHNAGADFSIVITNYPYVVQDLETLNLAYENLRAYFAQLPNQKLESFRNTATGKYQGRELVVEDKKNNLLMRIRVYIVGQRVYQLIVSASAENTSPAANDFYAKAANRFFDSFQFTGATPPVVEAAAIALPANIRGDIDDGNIYRNEYFGFSLKLPADWRALNRDEVGLAQEAGRSLLGSPDARRNAALAAAQKRIVNLLAISKSPMGLPENSIIMIAAEKIVNPAVTTRETSLATEKSMAEKASGAVRIIRPTFEMKIGAADFAGFEFELEMYGSRMRQQMFFTKRAGYDLIFGLGYSKDDDLKTLQTALQSLKFERKKQ